MHSFELLKRRSVSAEELVLAYDDAMELLSFFEQNSMQIFGWEGWLHFEDGSFGHSEAYQGTTDLSEMPILSAIELAKRTITEASKEWSQNPEFSNADLLFCIVAGRT